MPESAHYMLSTALIIIIIIIIIIILPPFFWLASPPRVFVTHTQNGYQNDRLGRESCAMSFLRDSRVFREFIREKLRIISHKE